MSNSETSRDLMSYVCDDIAATRAELQERRRSRDVPRDWPNKALAADVQRFYVSCCADSVARLKKLFAIRHRERGY